MADDWFDIDKIKMYMKKAANEPVSFAFGVGAKPAESKLAMHIKRNPKFLFKALKNEGFKPARILVGTAQTDGVLLIVTCEAEVPKVKKSIKAFLKDSTLLQKKVQLMGPDGEFGDEDDEDREEEAQEVFAESASTGAESKRDKIVSKLNEQIAALRQKQLQPQYESQKENLLMRVETYIETDKHLEAAKLLKAMNNQVMSAEAAKSAPARANPAQEAEAKAVFGEAGASFDPALKARIEQLEATGFPASMERVKAQFLQKAQDLLATGSTEKAVKLLDALEEKATLEIQKLEIQKNLDDLDDLYRQALKAVNYPTDKLKDAHDRVETRLKENNVNEAKNALSDLRFELRRLESQGEKTERLASLNDSLSKKLDAATDMLKPATGTTDNIEKQKLNAGKEFKSFLSSLKMVEKDPSEKNLLSLQQAAQAYIDHFNAKHADNKKRANDPNNKEKLRLSKEWHGKAKSMLRTRKSEEILKANPGDEWALERAQSEFGQAMIDAGLGGINESGGASDSYLVKDATGKNAFVFKPQKGEETPEGQPDGAGMPREAIQSKLADEMRNILGFDVPVARTTIVTTVNDMFEDGEKSTESEQVGVLQEFLDSDGTAKDRIQKGERAWIDQVDRKSLESMAVLDIIMLNGDRKGDNLLIKDQPDGKTRLMPIDAGGGLPSLKGFENGAAKTFFSPARGTSEDFGSNMYNLIPAANEPYSQESLDAIARLDPKEMRGKLAGHRQQMENDFPTTKGLIDDGNLDLSELAMRLLKRAAPSCSIVEVNYIIATKLAGLAKQPKVTDQQIDAAILQAKQVYVFVAEAQSKQFEATKLGNEIEVLKDAFEKAHPIGDKNRDAYEKLKAESKTYTRDMSTSLTKWENMTDATAITQYFDPHLAALKGMKRIMTAG